MTWKRKALLAGGALVALAVGGTAWASGGGPTGPGANGWSGGGGAFGGGNGRAPGTTASGFVGQSGRTQQPSGRPGGPGEGHPLLQSLAHADLTVVMNGTTYLVHIDHGKLQSVASTAISIQEADGKTVSVPISSDTRVLVNFRPASLSDLKPGMIVFTLRIGDGAARGVRAFDPSQLPQGGSGATAPRQPAPGGAAGQPSTGGLGSTAGVPSFAGF